MKFTYLPKLWKHFVLASKQFSIWYFKVKPYGSWRPEELNIICTHICVAWFLFHFFVYGLPTYLHATWNNHLLMYCKVQKSLEALDSNMVYLGDYYKVLQNFYSNRIYIYIYKSIILNMVYSLRGCIYGNLRFQIRLKPCIHLINFLTFFLKRTSWKIL